MLACVDSTSIVKSPYIPNWWSHGVGSMSDHPTTYIPNWWSHRANDFKIEK